MIEAHCVLFYRLVVLRELGLQFQTLPSYSSPEHSSLRTRAHIHLVLNDTDNLIRLFIFQLEPGPCEVALESGYNLSIPLDLIETVCDVRGWDGHQHLLFAFRDTILVLVMGLFFINSDPVHSSLKDKLREDRVEDEVLVFGEDFYALQVAV